MNIFGWTLCIHRQGELPIHKNSRIHTKYGWGTIAGVAVTVDLDLGTSLRPFKPNRNQPRVNVTHSLDK